MPDSSAIPESVSEVVRLLAEPKPMRRGSFSVRYLKCNKPDCQCATDQKARHGPYYSVVRTVGGKTQSRHVPAQMAKTLEAQVNTGKAFRKQIESYWQVCEQWADAQLEMDETVADEEAAKKRASKTVLTKKSRRKSKP